MIEPYKYRKKILKSGGSKYVLIPADWSHIDDKTVIVEVWSDKIVIKPVK